MVIRNLRSGRRLSVLALFAILAMSAFAFAAANTVPDTRAGDGDGDISGYTVTHVSYSLSSTVVGEIDEVSFDLDAAAGEVQVAFNGTGVFDCAVAGTSVTCDLAGEGVMALDVTSLRVIAVQ